MIKSKEITDPKSCFNRAAADEPIFVLRGKDLCAGYTVRMWANIAHQSGRHEPEKIAAARAFADEMEAYARARTEKAAA